MIGGPGSAPGKFSLPCQVAFLSLAETNDALVVFEMGNDGRSGWRDAPICPPRLQVLTLGGVPLQQLWLSHMPPRDYQVQYLSVQQDAIQVLYGTYDCGAAASRVTVRSCMTVIERL